MWSTTCFVYIISSYLILDQSSNTKTFIKKYICFSTWKDVAANRNDVAINTEVHEKIYTFSWSRDGSTLPSRDAAAPNKIYK